MSRDTVTPRSPITTKGSRSILDKLRRKDKGDRSGPESLRDLPTSTASLQPSINSAKLPRPELQQVPSGGIKKKGSLVPGLAPDMTQREKGVGSGKEGARKEHGRLPFKSKRMVTQAEIARARDLNEARGDPNGNDALFK